MNDSDFPNITSVQAILQKDYGAEAWTVDKLVPLQSITAISGAPGSFKTWLTLEIAKSVIRGIPFLDRFTVNKGNVLIIDKESPLRYIKERVEGLGMGGDRFHYHVKQEDFDINKKEDFEELSRAIKHFKINLVIFDSLIRIHSGEENDAGHMAKVMSAFRRLTQDKDNKPSVIFIHHNRKETEKSKSTPNSMRGSSDIHAGVDSLLQLNTSSKNVITVTQSKMKYAEKIDPFEIDFIVNEDNGAFELKYRGTASDKSKEASTDILTSVTEREKSRKEIINELSEKYTAQIISNSLKELERSAQIIKNVGPSNKHSYILKQPQ